MVFNGQIAMSDQNLTGNMVRNIVLRIIALVEVWISKNKMQMLPIQIHLVDLS